MNQNENRQLSQQRIFIKKTFLTVILKLNCIFDIVWYTDDFGPPFVFSFASWNDHSQRFLNQNCRKVARKVYFSLHINNIVFINSAEGKFTSHSLSLISYFRISTSCQGGDLRKLARRSNYQCLSTISCSLIQPKVNSLQFNFR